MRTSFDPMNNTSLMLDLISQRQRAIGSNIANVDTPGYVRRDVNFSSYLGNTSSSLETKLSAKLGSSGMLEEQTFEQVNPAQELIALQENSILYSMAARRMSNIITEMKTVINVGK